MLVTQIRGGNQGQAGQRNWGRYVEKGLNDNVCVMVDKRQNCNKDQGTEMGHKDHSLFGAGRGDPL